MNSESDVKRFSVIDSSLPMYVFVIDTDLPENEQTKRLMTVIDGIPFYCSSGTNSTQPGTWFPFLSIKENTGWIIKPKASVPSDVIDYCEQKEIQHEIVLTRFGTIRTWCISASLGGGFWEKEKGLDLKQYLIDQYPHYFLTTSQVDNIQIAQGNQNLKRLNGRFSINKQLKKLKVVIPINNIYARLPSDEEQVFFKRTETTEKIKAALTMMLVKGIKLSENAYEMLLFLSKDDELLDYILENYMLEDAAQFNQLIELVGAKKEKVTKTNLVEINQLSEFISLEWKKYLLKDPGFRKAIRLLAQNGSSFKIEELKLVKTLMQYNLIESCLNLLTQFESQYALRVLAASGSLDSDTINLVRELHERSLLGAGVYDLLLSEDSCRILKKLLKHKALNEETIELVIELDEEDELDENAIDELIQRYSSKDRTELAKQLQSNSPPHQTFFDSPAQPSAKIKSNKMPGNSPIPGKKTTEP